MATSLRQSGLAHTSCTDHVVGDILSGWRYDISGISPELRADFEEHLRECAHCHGRQRLHRSIDILLFAATTISFAAFLLASLLLYRLHALSHLAGLHVRLVHEAGLTHLHVPVNISVSLQAVALLGVLVSMLLWVLVAIATPAPDMVSDLVREHMLHDHRDPLHKQAA